MNLQSKWVNFLKPTYVSDEIKRKKLQVIIFFSITYGLSYSLGLLAICFNHLIDSEILAQFMMILPLSSVSIAKFYTCLLYTSPSPRDQRGSRMPSSA